MKSYPYHSFIHLVIHFFKNMFTGYLLYIKFSHSHQGCIYTYFPWSVYSPRSETAYTMEADINSKHLFHFLPINTFMCQINYRQSVNWLLKIETLNRTEPREASEFLRNYETITVCGISIEGACAGFLSVPLAFQTQGDLSAFVLAAPSIQSTIPQFWTWQALFSHPDLSANLTYLLRGKSPGHTI